jgi:hypothetical protein
MSRRLALRSALLSLLVLTTPAARLRPETAPGSPRRPPPLEAPRGPKVHVRTERQLQLAVQGLRSGKTILIEPGTYDLTATLRIDSGVKDVTIRGSTDSCDDVVLKGKGMANANHGGVPHGIWIGNARGVRIANLTIRDVYYHTIQLDPGAGAQAPHIYNVRLVDSGEQFIKASRSPDGKGVHDGVVEHCIMEYTSTARSHYTNGVDVLGGANWVVRRNLFKNIRAPAGKLAGPAVLMWMGSKDSIVEGNLFLNVQYGIALGLDPERPADHSGGIVRNNFFHRSRDQSGDVGIVINNCAGTKVLHNTIILSGTYPNAIEYRFPATTGVEIRYNLTDAAVQVRDDASGAVADNVTNAEPAWFAGAATGDLHLAESALGAIDKARPHPDAAEDYDAEERPARSAPDVGADELPPTTP